MTEEQLKSDLKQIEERLTELRHYVYTLDDISDDISSKKGIACKSIEYLNAEQHRLSRAFGAMFYALQLPELPSE